MILINGVQNQYDLYTAAFFNEKHPQLHAQHAAKLEKYTRAPIVTETVKMHCLHTCRFPLKTDGELIILI